MREVLNERMGMNILAKPGPGREALTEEWSIIVIFVYGFHLANNGPTDLSIFVCLELDC